MIATLLLGLGLPFWGPGNWDGDGCDRFLTCSANSGIQSITFIPSYQLDVANDGVGGAKVISERSVTTERLHHCLDKALDKGFQIVYKPHLESRDYKDHRINMNVDPKRIDFANLTMAPFLAWLNKNKEAIRKNPSSVIIYTNNELDRSTLLYPWSWIELHDWLRTELTAMGLRDKVLIGSNLIMWGNLPWNYPWLDDSEARQNKYYELLSDVDIVGFSAYGNWYNTTVKKKIRSYMNSYSWCRSGKCSLPRPEMKLAFAEAGIGVSLSGTEAFSNRMPNLPTDFKNRDMYYKTLFGTLKQLENQDDVPRLENITIWPNQQDPTACTREICPNCPSFRDENVVKMFKEFSQSKDKSTRTSAH